MPVTEMVMESLMVVLLTHLTLIQMVMVFLMESK